MVCNICGVFCSIVHVAVTLSTPSSGSRIGSAGTSSLIRFVVSDQRFEYFVSVASRALVFDATTHWYYSMLRQAETRLLCFCVARGHSRRSTMLLLNRAIAVSLMRSLSTNVVVARNSPPHSDLPPLCLQHDDECYCCGWPATDKPSVSLSMG